jgi:hypothetical protein
MSPCSPLRAPSRADQSGLGHAATIYSSVQGPPGVETPTTMHAKKSLVLLILAYSQNIVHPSYHTTHKLWGHAVLWVPQPTTEREKESLSMGVLFSPFLFVGIRSPIPRRVSDSKCIREKPLATRARQSAGEER